MAIAQLVRLLDYVTPVISRSADAPWDKGGLTPEEWNQQGEELFRGFEGKGVHGHVASPEQ